MCIIPRSGLYPSIPCIIEKSAVKDTHAFTSHITKTPKLRRFTSNSAPVQSVIQEIDQQMGILSRESVLKLIIAK
jgi:hypothetical protein